LFHPNGSSPIQKYQKNIKKSKREAKGEQEEVKQILNETLFKYLCSKQPSHHFLAFTIIYFHTPSLGHDTSLIKFTQIKDWLLSFESFNLEKHFYLLIGLF